jgi:tetratricopeptide (TPR) repeat protein
VVTFLEDIHWADAPSIDLLHDLVAALPDGRWLIVGLTRGTFFENRPGWGRDLPGFSRLQLGPLSPPATRALVAEILQKAPAIPTALLDLIAGSAEGNPFYVEELVKMLVDEDVIVPGDVQWRVHAERLRGLRVPSTLTGVLQARLDSLPETERAVLQRASVIGRSFWDSAVAALVNGSGRLATGGLRPVLRSIHDRELILRRDRSAFAGTEEFIFKHALLRDVTYETVPLRRRREYHALAARWLEANAGERLGEYLEVVAEHFALAGDHAAAAGYLERAAEQALRASAFRPALDILFRAVNLLGMDFDGRPMLTAALQVKLAETCWHLGEFTAAEVWAESARTEARRQDEPGVEAEALYWLSQTAVSLGDYERAQAYLSESLPLARAARPETLARVLYGLGDVGSRALPPDHTPESVSGVRACLEESLALARELDDLTLQLFALNRLGALSNQVADYTTAGKLWTECLELAVAAGNRERQAAALTNLGLAAFFRDDLALAADYTRQALDIDRELGRQDAVAHDLLNLSEYRALLGDLESARRDLREGLALAWQSGTMPRVLHGLFVHASMLVREGEPEEAVALLRFLRRHPAADSDVHAAATALLADVGRSAYPIPALDLDEIIPRVLGTPSPLA